MKNRIKEVRKSKGLSQKDFGKNINLSQNHVSSLENGARSITTRTIDDICRVYGINREWLVNEKGKMCSDVLEKFEISDPDVEEFTRMFLELDGGAKKIITELMKKALQEEKESD